MMDRNLPNLAYPTGDLARLISPAGEHPTVLLVTEDEATEVALRRTLAWLLHNPVRAKADAPQPGNAQAVIWKMDAPEEETLQRLRHWRQACPDLPLLVLVREGCPAQAVERVQEVGADQVLVLPVDEGRLARALRQALGRRQRKENGWASSPICPR
ncbi:MAG: hypothetical protein ACP5OO_02725 [Chloroflexia bacterium]